MSYDIAIMEECASWQSTIEVASSSGAGTWTVTFTGPEGPAFCDCPAYKFSRENHCKHIDQAYREGCFWHQQWCDEPLVEHGKCPRCGGETIYVRVAV